MMDYEMWANFGPEEDECADDRCYCDRCMEEPEDDSDIEINEKPREGARETWTGA